MNKYKLIFFFLSLTSFLSGQTPEIKFERFGFKQGLYDSGFDNIVQDRKGFIWTGNSRVYRFDGYKFKTVGESPGTKVYPADTINGACRMFEDTLGLIWIIYAGRGIALFNPEDDKSIKLMDAFPHTNSENDDWTKCVITTKISGNCFWLVTRAGLLRLTYKKGIPESIMKEKVFNRKFGEIIDVDTFKITLKKGDFFHIIFKDSWNNIWVGTEFSLYFMRNGTRSFELVDYDENGKCKLPDTDVEFMVQEDEDSFIIGSWYGLYTMSNVRNALMGNNPDKSKLIFHREKLFVNASCVFKDRNNNIYAASEKNLYLVKRDIIRNKYSFIPLYKNVTEKDGDRFCQSFNIMQDREGIIWLGQEFNGLLKFNPEDTKFINYKNVLSGGNENENMAAFLFEDSQGNVLAGGRRIFKILPGGKKSISFKTKTTPNFLDCITEIKPDIFWIGRFRGISEFNARTGQVYDPFPPSREADTLRSITWVWNMLKDENIEYICTSEGLFVYDFSTSRLHKFNVEKGAQFIDIVRSNDGSIWVLTESMKGLYKLNYNQRDGRMSFIPLNDKNLSVKNLLNSKNECLFADSEGYLWVGNDNKCGNLHRINTLTGEIKTYNLNKQQKYSPISSINEDRHGNLWLGTFSGLIRFNKLTEDVKVFTEDDGLPLNTHTLHSAFRSRDGRLFFGGKNGFYCFNPDSVKINNSIPRIVLTDFRLFNKSIHPNSLDNDILKKDISYTNQIELNYKQNDITFEFAALDYSNPMENNYAYKLVGYKNEWVNTDATNRLASFTNLSPGTYTFIVKGSNNDGVWNEVGTSLRIIIHKPWYGTILAWVIYVLMFIGATAAFVMWRLSALKREKIKLENQVQERTHEIEIQKEEILAQRNLVEEQNQQIIELDQLRTRFFTNISHEFRTPLALIQSPVEELLEDPKRNERERKKLSMVQRNAGRLLTLVNQLLDISKMDGSSMKLELVEGDVMKHLNGLVKNFTSLAELKGIIYEIHFTDDVYITWYDPDKLEKIIVNLLSNAFKFTPEGGNISLNAKYIISNDPGISRYLEFSVTDTGTGIPDESLEKIFDRFYQVESSVKKEGGGTGIGLSLARDMARLMHGDIIVKSQLCTGSVFSVKIPLGKDFLNAGEFIILKKMPSGYSLQSDLHNTLYEATNSSENEVPAGDKPILLIVEDNMDIRLQLKDNLSGVYNIIEAVDGKAGFKKATEVIPDIIITDIMMPRMDGSEMCHKLKNDERTSHIPVIMLTAKVTHSDKIDGYHTGADDYIPKPFLMAELKARAANLLLQRQKLREKFSREIKLEATDVLITPLDEKFLKRAVETVEKHIAEEDFDLIKFRAEMSMSRSTLSRKLHALTGESPTDFIRNIRLKRAADLLKKKFGNVTQVSFEVGFSNLSYFNKAFKKFYGATPTEYAKKYPSDPKTAR